MHFLLVLKCNIWPVLANDLSRRDKLEHSPEQDAQQTGADIGPVPQELNSYQLTAITEHKQETALCCFKSLRFGNYLLLQHNLNCPTYTILKSDLKYNMPR